MAAATLIGRAHAGLYFGMDPTWAAAHNPDAGDPAMLFSLTIMVAGIVLVVIAALFEHYSGRSNLVTRALDRWSR